MREDASIEERSDNGKSDHSELVSSVDEDSRDDWRLGCCETVL